MTQKSKHTVDIDTELGQSVHLLTAYMIHQSGKVKQLASISDAGDGDHSPVTKRLRLPVSPQQVQVIDATTGHAYSSKRAGYYQKGVPGWPGKHSGACHINVFGLHAKARSLTSLLMLSPDQGCVLEVSGGCTVDQLL
jgi:hypothetical protein